MLEQLINQNIIYILLILICGIIIIVRKAMGKDDNDDTGDTFGGNFNGSTKREQFMEQMNKIADDSAKNNAAGGQFRMGDIGVPVKTVSVQEQVAQYVEGFNEQAEIEKIKIAMAKYMLATSAGNKNFDVLQDFCAKSVVTSAQFEAMKAKISYSGVNVLHVAFTRCEQKLQETSIFGLAYVEYNGFNGKTSTPFNATFSFKYSYVYREKTDRKSLKCPKCGAPVSDYGAQTCEFCGEQLGNMLMERSWAFTEITRTENRIKYTGA